MTKKLLVYLQYIFFIGLAAFFVWLSLRNLNAEKWDLLKKALGQAKLLIVFPVLFLMLASHWFRAIRWKMLIEPLGYKPGNLNTFFGFHCKCADSIKLQNNRYCSNQYQTNEIKCSLGDDRSNQFVRRNFFVPG